MGSDFNTRWFFGGRTDPGTACDAVVSRLREALRHAGFEEIEHEADAARSVVVRSCLRWVFSGDSASCSDLRAQRDYDALSRDLSTIGPVIDVKMSDGAAVHFYLYRQGRLVDQFGNSAFPFYRFPDESEAARYAGQPELWADFLAHPDAVYRLRAIWRQGALGDDILAETGALFGWDPQLIWTGYTHDYEGIPTKYDDYLREVGVEMRDFIELHFKLGSGAGCRR